MEQKKSKIYLPPIFVVATANFLHPTVPLDRWETCEAETVSGRLFPKEVFKTWRLDHFGQVLLIKEYSEEITSRLVKWVSKHFPEKVIVFRSLQ